MERKKLIKTFKSNGHDGYCKGCGSYFKKNDYGIIFEKFKKLKVTEIKLCVYCYLSQVASRIGWKKINELILKMSVRRL